MYNQCHVFVTSLATMAVAIATNAKQTKYQQSIGNDKFEILSHNFDDCHP